MILDAIKSEINLMSRPIEEAVAGNETLQYPTPKPEKYDFFWQNMKEYSFEESMHITFKKEYDTIRINKIKYLIIAPLKFIKHRILKKYIKNFL